MLVLSRYCVINAHCGKILSQAYVCRRLWSGDVGLVCMSVYWSQ